MLEEEKSQGVLRKQRKPFVMSPTHLFTNPTISSIAKTLWQILESKPDGWRFFWSEILRHFYEGRNAVKNAMKELENFGYVRKQRAKKGNIFYGMDIEVFYDPSLPFDQENQGSARVTENRSPENGSAEIRATENGYIKKEILKKDGLKKDQNKYPLSLEKMEAYARENNFKIDVKNFHQWCVDEEKLFTGWKNIMKTWAANPRNQIIAKPSFSKTKPSKDEEKKGEMLSKVKFLVDQASNGQASQHFAMSEIDLKTLTIFVKNPKALQYQEILDKINLKIEVKNVS
jgi:hypothetical protein